MTALGSAKAVVAVVKDRPCLRMLIAFLWVSYSIFKKIIRSEVFLPDPLAVFVVAGYDGGY